MVDLSRYNWKLPILLLLYLENKKIHLLI